jgi:hypothetical protein
MNKCQLLGRKTLRGNPEKGFQIHYAQKLSSRLAVVADLHTEFELKRERVTRRPSHKYLLRDRKEWMGLASSDYCAGKAITRNTIISALMIAIVAPARRR